MLYEEAVLSDLKELLAARLREVVEKSEKLIGNLHSETECLLCDLEEIKKSFYAIQSSASTFYLKAYLADYIENFQALAKAIDHLSKLRHGALIVVERDTSVDGLIHKGISVNAELSSSLLESIFYPGSPLHDGAVLIKDEVIVSAANVLPLSGIKTGENKLGTRHRAALGLSEVSDALILVISEETGRMSFAKNGTLYPISSNNL
ncbi:sporulation-specific diadenylate cyclase CdaS [Metabacillus sp. GX 13764]|uniref:sporulation-specific diadenylate cyclase CdaS n=1 Tax=Metabacillus kandeliae TaxID=2900151 RepID=UPI001E30690E|nr:sporulation-specific diadenylate cyclase CdaS [Metabacillus kandeliae]MCD7033516.1 sporulation-specific diadenylate cyclase CdaS [Metabacillus kandeliae]